MIRSDNLSKSNEKKVIWINKILHLTIYTYILIVSVLKILEISALSLNYIKFTLVLSFFGIMCAVLVRFKEKGGYIQILMSYVIIIIFIIQANVLLNWGIVKSEFIAFCLTGFLLSLLYANILKNYILNREEE